GAVLAALSCCAAIPDFSQLAGPQAVGLVRLHAVVTRSAADHVAPAVADLYDIVARSGRDAVLAAPAPDGVVAVARLDPVVPGAAVDRALYAVGVDPVAAGAAVDEVDARPGVKPVAPGAAEQAIVAGLPEDHVG